jgi:hypothetical protein
MRAGISFQPVQLATSGRFNNHDNVIFGCARAVSIGGYSQPWVSRIGVDLRMRRPSVLRMWMPGILQSVRVPAGRGIRGAFVPCGIAPRVVTKSPPPHAGLNHLN